MISIVYTDSDQITDILKQDILLYTQLINIIVIAKNGDDEVFTVRYSVDTDSYYLVELSSPDYTDRYNFRITDAFKEFLTDSIERADVSSIEIHISGDLVPEVRSNPFNNNNISVQDIAAEFVKSDLQDQYLLKNSGTGGVPGGGTEGGDDVYPWAEEGNLDPIPAGKLVNAPSEAGTGLSEEEVDARVKVGVQDWAETGNEEDIPHGKLHQALTEDSKAVLGNIRVDYINEHITPNQWNALSANDLFEDIASWQFVDTEDSLFAPGLSDQISDVYGEPSHFRQGTSPQTSNQTQAQILLYGLNNATNQCGYAPGGEPIKLWYKIKEKPDRSNNFSAYDICGRSTNEYTFSSTAYYVSDIVFLDGSNFSLPGYRNSNGVVKHYKINPADDSYTLAPSFIDEELKERFRIDLVLNNNWNIRREVDRNNNRINANSEVISNVSIKTNAQGDRIRILEETVEGNRNELNYVLDHVLDFKQFGYYNPNSEEVDLGHYPVRDKFGDILGLIGDIEGVEGKFVSEVVSGRVNIGSSNGALAFRKRSDDIDHDVALYLAGTEANQPDYLDITKIDSDQVVRYTRLGASVETLNFGTGDVPGIEVRYANDDEPLDLFTVLRGFAHISGSGLTVLRITQTPFIPFNQDGARYDVLSFDSNEIKESYRSENDIWYRVHTETKVLVGTDDPNDGDVQAEQGSLYIQTENEELRRVFLRGASDLEFPWSVVFEQAPDGQSIIIGHVDPNGTLHNVPTAADILNSSNTPIALTAGMTHYGSIAYDNPASVNNITIHDENGVSLDGALVSVSRTLGIVVAGTLARTDFPETLIIETTSGTFQVTRSSGPFSRSITANGVVSTARIHNYSPNGDYLEPGEQVLAIHSTGGTITINLPLVEETRNEVFAPLNTIYKKIDDDEQLESEWRRIQVEEDEPHWQLIYETANPEKLISNLPPTKAGGGVRAGRYFRNQGSTDTPDISVGLLVSSLSSVTNDGRHRSNDYMGANKILTCTLLPQGDERLCALELYENEINLSIIATSQSSQYPDEIFGIVDGSQCKWYKKTLTVQEVRDFNINDVNRITVAQTYIQLYGNKPHSESLISDIRGASGSHVITSTVAPEDLVAKNGSIFTETEEIFRTRVAGKWVKTIDGWEKFDDANSSLDSIREQIGVQKADFLINDGYYPNITSEVAGISDDYWVAADRKIYKRGGESGTTPVSIGTFTLPTILTHPDAKCIGLTQFTTGSTTVVATMVYVNRTVQTNAFILMGVIDNTSGLLTNQNDSTAISYNANSEILSVGGRGVIGLISYLQGGSHRIAAVVLRVKDATSTERNIFIISGNLTIRSTGVPQWDQHTDHSQNTNIEADQNLIWDAVLPSIIQIGSDYHLGVLVESNGLFEIRAYNRSYTSSHSLGLQNTNFTRLYRGHPTLKGHGVGVTVNQENNITAGYSIATTEGVTVWGKNNVQNRVSLLETTPEHVFITQTEYDALPDDKKADASKIYFTST